MLNKFSEIDDEIILKVRKSECGEVFFGWIDWKDFNEAEGSELLWADCEIAGDLQANKQV
jgi:hypothetical protein